jgi:UDP-2,3-diacylglucosamine hydrolase
MLRQQDRLAEAVFIADLHLDPKEPLIIERFNTFIDWAAVNTSSVYILGDFFHAWPGDDGLEPWSKAIAKRLRWLSRQGVAVYFMHGNRDFLLGERFADFAGMTILPEPTIINLDQRKILLVHGDRYCINDKSHQWFRWITRNPWFRNIFLYLPLQLRVRIVNKVRQRSQSMKFKTLSQMDVVLAPMIKHMQEQSVKILIHGHTHKPGLSNHLYNGIDYSQYVLSAWDDSPRLLCYDKSNGFEFIQI